MSQPPQQPYQPQQSQQGGYPPQQGYGQQQQQQQGQYRGPPQQGQQQGGFAPPQSQQGHYQQQQGPPQGQYQQQRPPQGQYQQQRPPQGQYQQQGNYQQGVPQGQYQQYPPQQQGGYGAHPQQGYGHQQGPPCTIKVRVAAGRNLKAADINGKSDPYCTILWEGSPKAHQGNMKNMKDKKNKNKSGKQQKWNKHQTNVVKKTLSPTWNQTFTFNVPPPVKAEDVITFTVWDWDARGEHDFLGSCHIHPESLVQGQEKVQWFKLQNIKKGEIQVGLTAVNFSTGPVNQQKAHAAQQVAAKSAVSRAKAKKNKAAKKNVKKVGKFLGKVF